MKKMILAGLLFTQGVTVAMDAEPKALLFDLGGMFFDISQAEYAQEMGLSKLAAYVLLDWKNPGNMKRLIFGVLERVAIQDKDPGLKPAHDTKGNAMPYLLSAYQAGRYTTDEARRLALEAFEVLKGEDHFSCSREEDLVESALGLMFNPELYASTMIKPYPKALELLNELGALEDESGRKRYTLIAVSNWDKDSSVLLRERFSEELSCFDDFVISGEVGSVKPNRAIFDLAIEKSGVLKEECLFIDDQHENIAAARALGIKSVLYKNAKQAREEFGKLGLPVRAETPTSRVPLVIATTALVASGAWLLSLLG